VNKLIVPAMLGILLIFGNVGANESNGGISIKGDFRYRHEMIDKEASEVRHRHRLRARFYLEGTVNDHSKIILGLSSGSSDPVSNNQTLTGSFSSKGLLIDLAYFQIMPEGVPGLKAIGGKMKNPYFKPGGSELIWDSDIRQEGIAAFYSRTEENVSVGIMGAGFWIEENKAGDDAYLLGGQATGSYHLPEKSGHLKGGVSFFNYVNTRGFATFYDEEDSYGNTVDDSGWYAFDYELLEIGAEVYYRINWIPVTAMFDYVTNTAADSLNTGWLAGITVGKTGKPGSWDFRYIYRELKRDAVLGLFADSDFRGGGTDAKGHEVGASLQVMEKTTFAVTYFHNEIGFEDSLDFQRLQVDLKFKF